MVTRALETRLVEDMHTMTERCKIYQITQGDNFYRPPPPPPPTSILLSSRCRRPGCEIRDLSRPTVLTQKGRVTRSQSFRERETTFDMYCHIKQRNFKFYQPSNQDSIQYKSLLLFYIINKVSLQ